MPFFRGINRGPAETRIVSQNNPVHRRYGSLVKNLVKNHASRSVHVKFAYPCSSPSNYWNQQGTPHQTTSWYSCVDSGASKSNIPKVMDQAISHTSTNELTQRIKNCCQQIRNKPEIFERVRSSMKRRAELCVKMDGGHIEHLL
ncbi:hypothetical protein ALC53_12654 [Atta colombica]|uniref:Uncharacterized protein n=1 Tax=Atta colombica TaxID=520822 RepID=A0A151HZ80_9HYME|nr:hypothetical protein ALC53_12654 [Atta colombica]